MSFNNWQLKKPKKLEYSNKINRSKSESAVILIAGSVAINGSYISTRKPINKYTTSDLQGTITDTTNMYKLFLQSKGADVIRVFTDVDPTTKTKQIVLHSMKDLFNIMDYKRYIIYYSGHGKYTGDWVFDNGSQQFEYITLNDILFLWNNRMRNTDFKQDLIIISDSCHSGYWVDKLKRLKPTDIWMQAASLSHQYSYDDIDGGIFTSNYVNSACRFISTDDYFNILLYIGGIILSSIGSIIAILKDKLIGYAYHCISKPFQPTYYVPRYDQDDEYYFDRIYMGITTDNKYHLHCYFFNQWADLDFIKTVNYYAKYGSLGTMGTIMSFDMPHFIYYMALLMCFGFIIRIGWKLGVFDVKLFDIFAVYTVGIVTRLYFL